MYDIFGALSRKMSVCDCDKDLLYLDENLAGFLLISRQIFKKNFVPPENSVLLENVEHF